MWDSLFSPQYSRATWVCFGISCISQLTANGPINIFSTSILTTWQEESKGTFPISPITGAYLLGIANFVFALLSTIPIKYLGMRTIMIFGQIGMAICHLLIGIG